jgi:hypothetical protein
MEHLSFISMEEKDKLRKELEGLVKRRELLIHTIKENDVSRKDR